mmetsp:Transcript_104970/g.321586  ORF Transcript_104970/g.321586 Transcript_104970/m.321586 type:complete len:178 (-) Transcript_104970:206-739(-)
MPKRRLEEAPGGPGRPVQLPDKPLGGPGADKLAPQGKPAKAKKGKSDKQEKKETDGQRSAGQRTGQPEEKALKTPRLPRPAAAAAVAGPGASSSQPAAGLRDEPRRAPERKRPASAADHKLAVELIEGAPGVQSPRFIPLSLLTKHQSVAWQWKVKGEMHYPIPIGCTRPLSPFSSE